VDEKSVEWMGSSHEDLRGFPKEARDEAGYQLWLVQQGESPRDWKPLRSVGPGAREIRIHTWSGGRLEHRVVYVARFAEAVYVLHVFRKTSRKTSRSDLKTAQERYAEMLRLREKGG
jgi:phage-related protein